MRAKIDLGLLFVFAGTSIISWGVVLGFYHLFDDTALGLVIMVFLSGFGTLAFLRGRKLIATYPECDLGPQICLMALLGVVIGITTTCCDILLPQYRSIFLPAKMCLGSVIIFWVTMLTRRFEDRDSSAVKTQK